VLGALDLDGAGRDAVTRILYCPNSAQATFVNISMPPLLAV
jgi:hypothetical protein